LNNGLTISNKLNGNCTVGGCLLDGAGSRYDRGRRRSASVFDGELVQLTSAAVQHNDIALVYRCPENIMSLRNQ